MYSLLYYTIFPAIGNFLGFVGTLFSLPTFDAFWYIKQGIAVNTHLFNYHNLFTGEVLLSPHAPDWISQTIGIIINSFIEKLEHFIPNIWDIPFWVTCIFVSIVIIAFGWVLTAVFKLLF